MIDVLLRERDVRRYGLFGVTTEGRVLPDGSESASGFLVTDGGLVYSFWLDWDASSRRVAFTDWELVAPAPDWEEDQEYREARREAGLT